MKIIRYIKKVILNNPIKSFFLGCLLVLIGLAIHFNRLETIQSKVSSSFELDGKFYYAIHKDHFMIKEFDEKLPIVDGKITYQEKSDLFGIFTILSVFLGIFVFLTFVIPDNNDGWNFKDNWYDVSVDEVSCEFEDGIFYYVYKGKLIYHDKYQLDRYSFRSKIREFNRQGANLCPDFLTKSQRRDQKLKEIFK